MLEGRINCDKRVFFLSLFCSIRVRAHGRATFWTKLLQRAGKKLSDIRSAARGAFVEASCVFIFAVNGSLLEE